MNSTLLAYLLEYLKRNDMSIFKHKLNTTVMQGNKQNVLRVYSLEKDRSHSKKKGKM